MTEILFLVIPSVFSWSMLGRGSSAAFLMPHPEKSALRPTPHRTHPVRVAVVALVRTCSVEIVANVVQEGHVKTPVILLTIKIYRDLEIGREEQRLLPRIGSIAPLPLYFPIPTTPSTWMYVRNFFANLQPYLRPANRNWYIFSSSFMHYKLYMLLLQDNHNMFCDIQIFSATTVTAEALLHFSIQELTFVYCLGD